MVRTATWNTSGKAKAAVGIPIIASLNGISTGGWVRYAQQIEQAGADALELNIYFMPTDPDMTGAQVEQMYSELVSHVKASVRISRSGEARSVFSPASAIFASVWTRPAPTRLVLFNRFYQPDFDLENLEVEPNLVLSDSSELLPAVALGGGFCTARSAPDLAITGGVHTAPGRGEEHDGRRHAWP